MDEHRIEAGSIRIWTLKPQYRHMALCPPPVGYEHGESRLLFDGWGCSCGASGVDERGIQEHIAQFGGSGTTVRYHVRDY